MEQIISSVTFIAIAIVLFIVFREVIMWYYKINERVKLQKDTNELLTKILERLNKDEPIQNLGKTITSGTKNL